MRRTKEQAETASKLKELHQEHNILTERNTHLTSLLHQQWENYRKTRYREDLMLLITILHEANLVQERLLRLSHNQSEYETQLKQKPVRPSAKASAERLKAVTMELRELNKKRKVRSPGVLAHPRSWLSRGIRRNRESSGRFRSPCPSTS